MAHSPDFCRGGRHRCSASMFVSARMSTRNFRGIRSEPSTRKDRRNSSRMHCSCTRRTGSDSWLATIHGIVCLVRKDKQNMDFDAIPRYPLSVLSRRLEVEYAGRYRVGVTRSRRDLGSDEQPPEVPKWQAFECSRFFFGFEDCGASSDRIGFRLGYRHRPIRYRGTWVASPSGRSGISGQFRNAIRRGASFALRRFDFSQVRHGCQPWSSRRFFVRATRYGPKTRKASANSCP
jgi:hypothetical protein